MISKTQYKKVELAIEILKDTNIEMPSTLLIETIDYARHILGDKERQQKLKECEEFIKRYENGERE